MVLLFPAFLFPLVASFSTWTTKTPHDVRKTTNVTVIDRAPYTLHLFSLPPKDDKYKLPGETLVRECWKWKDSTLGDGRDYFVPKPKALKAFQSLFLGMIVDVVCCIDNSNQYNPVEVVLSMPSSDSTVRLLLSSSMDDLSGDHSETCSFTFKVVECVALSNCARFETIFVLEDQRTSIDCIQNMTKWSDIAGRYATAYQLQQQVYSKRTKSSTLLERAGLTSWLDLPEAVVTQSNFGNNLSEKQSSEIIQLAQRLSSIDGALNLSTHLSLIAGGLAPRPNRPDREVVFRPYSSRDAHILLQLKRTVEVVSVIDREEGQGRGD